MFLFSQPPPFRISLTSIWSSSHCSKCTTGVSAPRLLPLFFPVMESTEFGRSLPSRVASATAWWIALRMTIWFTPTGVWTTNVGIPVSWQMAPSSSAAMSMFDRMMSSACEDCVPGVSPPAVFDIAARTSGGKFVDVWMTNSNKLLAKNSIIIFRYLYCIRAARRATFPRPPLLLYLEPHVRQHPRLDRRQRALEFHHYLVALDLFHPARNPRALQIQDQHQRLLPRPQLVQNRRGRLPPPLQREHVRGDLE